MAVMSSSSTFNNCKYAKAHVNPAGPSDDRPTAQHIIDDASLRGQLTGLVVLVTGGNSGIGLQIVKALYTTGAKVQQS